MLLKNLDSHFDFLRLNLESKLLHIESFYFNVCAVLLEPEGSLCGFEKVEC